MKTEPGTNAFTILTTCGMLLGLCATVTPGSQALSDVDRLKASVLKGSVPDAESLARLRDKPAMEAMREVLQRSDDVQVKMAIIEGLGRNKDFACVPVLLDIMEKNDKLKELRAKANEAVESIGVTGYFYKPDEPWDDRREKVSKMRLELKKMQDRQGEAVAVGRPLPNAKLYVRYSPWAELYDLSIPFAEYSARMRVSTKRPETARTFYLELESASVDFNWDWNDLVIRVDINSDGSLTITAIDAIVSPVTYDIFDSQGKLLLFDIGPKTGNPTYTFRK